jgi:hypothetical protein
MSTCLITYGYNIPCKSTGGVQAVWVGAWDSGLTYTYDSSAPGITSSYNTITGFGGTTGSWYRFDQNLETASYTENAAGSVENGTYFSTQTLEITLYSVQQAMVEQLNILGRGRWRVVILDQNGNYFIMGKQNPVNVITATPGLGKAYGDLNGAIVTFEGKEPGSIWQVAQSALGDLGIS